MPLARLKNGIELCYDERGDGEPLVLVMGIAAQMIFWQDDFCQMLADRGFRVIRFDHRDVGLSTRLHHLPVPSAPRSLACMLTGLRCRAPYALEDMAGDVAGLLDALAIERAHVVGVSMGGMVAQTMAITHPHRMRSLVSIMSTTGAPGVLISEPRAIRALLSSPPRTREEAIEKHLALFRIVRSTRWELDEDELIAKLGEQGVGCGIYYPKTVYDYDCYREHPRVIADPAPVTERVVKQCVSLPVHHHLTDAEVDQVIEAVRTAVGA